MNNRTYTLPSRLIGIEVEVRQYADHLEVYYKGKFVERMDRAHGVGEARIDYRHIIGSLVRKPGAFAPLPLQGADVPDADLPPGGGITGGSGQPPSGARLRQGHR